MIIDQAVNNPTPVIRYSDYLNITALQGVEQRKLGDEEYFIICNAQFTYKFVEEFVKTEPSIHFNGYTLHPESAVMSEISLKNSTNKDITGVLVVPDHATKGLEVMEVSIIANFKTEIDEKMDQKLFETFHEFGEKRYLVITTYATDEAAISTSVTLMFVGMYLGLTFAITSATVLAIGQLTDISDNKERYMILRQLGADNKLVNKALFTQIAIIFILPLLVAIVHSFVGITKFTRIIEMLFKVNMLGSIIKTALFIIAIYGGYMYVTFLNAKRTIASKL
jgi:putative ABC transport system permease protein